MAALASSAVTVTAAWQHPAPGGPPVTHKLLTIVLDSQGGATNTIGASALGFVKLLHSSMLQKSDDSAAVPAMPSYDGSTLFLYNPAQATDADRTDPADFTGTFRGVISGIT